MLLEKIKDDENKFSYVARLCSIKCDEMQTVCTIQMMNYPHMPTADKGIIAEGMLDNASEILLRLGLG
jgi:hypothetical protein